MISGTGVVSHLLCYNNFSFCILFRIFLIVATCCKLSYPALLLSYILNVVGPNSLSIKENDTAEFRAEIIGKPTPTVKWQLNGRELSASDANITIKSFESVYILRIERANVKHSGEVIVTAENAVGKVEKEAVLKVRI